MKNVILLFIALVTTSMAFAQKLKPLNDYLAKLPEFKTWLNEQGVDQVLKVHEIEIDNDTLEVYLAFIMEDTDSSSAAWDTLKSGFNDLKDYSFEEYLFYNMAAIFKVPLPKANIQIYDTYKSNVQPCFYVGIWFDTQSRGVKQEESFCMSKSAEASIVLEDLKNIKSVKIDLNNENLSRKNVYNRILAMAKSYYRPKITDFNNNFFTDYSGNETILEFEVKNIRQEVLYEDDDWICGTIKWIKKDFDCDLRKKEYIKIVIEYKSTTAGIFINCTVDARYGSSGTSLLTWERSNPMEPEFESYVARYAKKFKQMIQKDLGL